jgi:glyoxylase-like metal-dependent hydrolase (beta-lactamase superfamily II)
LHIGELTLTRVGYADVEIPAEVAGLTAEEVRAATWAAPVWATGEQLRAGAAAWIIDTGEARVVVDAAMAADDILRNDSDAAAHQEAFAALLEAAGFPRETITHAVATHIETIGMFGWRTDTGTWTRFFPNAPVLIPQRELDAFDEGRHPAVDGFGARALRALDDVRPLADHDTVVPGVAVELTGGHSPGNQVVRISSHGEEAVMVGHLAISPVHFVTGENPIEHPWPDVAEQVLDKLRSEDVVLIGPLWPAPGAGRWDGTGVVPVAQ